MSAGKFEAGNAVAPSAEWLALVRRQVETLHYGAVQIIVHDSQVTQVEKTERMRLEKPRAQTV